MDNRDITLTEAQEEAIINCGAFKYLPEKISNVLDLPLEYVYSNLKDKSSKLYKLYKKGMDMYDYTVDLKLFDLIRSGDIKALDKLEQRRKK